MSFTCASTGRHTEGKPARVITEIRLKTYPPRDTGNDRRGEPKPKDEGGTGWEIAKEVNMSTEAAIAFCNSRAGQEIEKTIGRPPSNVVQPKPKPQPQAPQHGLAPNPHCPPPVSVPKI